MLLPIQNKTKKEDEQRTTDKDAASILATTTEEKKSFLLALPLLKDRCIAFTAEVPASVTLVAGAGFSTVHSYLPTLVPYTYLFEQMNQDTPFQMLYKMKISRRIVEGGGGEMQKTK